MIAIKHSNMNMQKEIERSKVEETKQHEHATTQRRPKRPKVNQIQIDSYAETRKRCGTALRLL